MEDNCKDTKMGGENKKGIIGIYVTVVLIFVIMAGIVYARTNQMTETQTGEYQAQNKKAAFIEIPIQGSEVIQSINAVHDDLDQFLIFFDHFSENDSAVLAVTLEDAEGHEYYRYTCPTCAFGGESFCLVANVEEKLCKGHDYEIHVKLQEGESDITVRAVNRDAVHDSIKELITDGRVEENSALYLIEDYHYEIRYDHNCYLILFLALVIVTIFMFVKIPHIIYFWRIMEVPFMAISGYLCFQLLDSGWEDVGAFYCRVNLILLLGILLFLRGILPHISYYISGFLILLVAGADYYVLQFRGTQLIVSDIEYFKTAMTVVDNYSFALSAKLLTAICFIGALIVIHAFAEVCARRFGEKDIRIKCKKAFQNLTGFKRAGLVYRCMTQMVLLAIGLLLIYGVYERKESSKFQVSSMAASFKEMGYCYSNLCIVKLSSMKKPADYSAAKLEKILKNVGEPEIKKGSVIPKNLIVIMNESLADMKKVGNLETDRDYMPYIRSLKENTTQGLVSVSTLGGGTCITEWEFLTGNTQHFLPGGAKGYFRLFAENEPGIVRTVRSQGYHTVAMHPYKPGNWNRNKVYPAMGFDEFIDESGYEGYDKIRNFISDKGDYQKIIDYYEAFDKSEGLFIFNVTMQNHGGYGVDVGAIEKTIHIENIEEKDIAENYLSLIYESDQAFEYLISYFSKVEEPTMILMFGDHYPALPDAFYKELRNNDSSKEKLSLLCETPYVLWTNYKEEFDEIPLISANYLGSYFLQCAGLELTDYDKFLLDFRRKVPAIGMYGIKDHNGVLTTYKMLDDKILSDYRMMQYMRLKDRKSDLQRIFSLK